MLRRVKAASLLIAVAATVAIVVTGSHPAAAALRPIPHRVVVFVGDSYTAGAGATTGVTRFTTILARRYGWTEVNLGRGGTGYLGSVAGNNSKVACGLAYCPNYREMIPDIVVAHPNLVIVSGGRNDRRRLDRAWGEQVEGFYRDLRAALPGVPVYATSPILGGWEVVTPDMRVMAATVWWAVTQAGGRYLDLHDPLAGHGEWMAVGDGVHPNDLGHQKIADAIVSALAPRP